MSNPAVDSNMHGHLTGCRDKTVAKKGTMLQKHWRISKRKRNKGIRNIIFFLRLCDRLSWIQ
jgi:hypothetical protein